MKQIGNYSVEETPIGTGGMGQVFRGVSFDGYTPIAIKEILPQFASNQEFRMRIENEINFLKKLDSPNIVKIFDYFEIGGSLYIVMEFVDGLNVEQYIAERGRLTWQDAAGIMTQLLQTMQYVHETGIVHRDIKPGNIMIKENGQVCLLDFGIAKDVSSNNGPKKRQTLIGTVIGTDGYMSPEQAKGFDIDHRSDIYALGCLLFFMLTGTHAFDSTMPELAIYDAIVNGNFPRLADRVKGLPSALQNVMDHATDKNMMKRYQSCREFSNELTASLPGGTHINSIIDNDKLSVSIGRENCDLTVGLQNYKVSRHHADVELVRSTGGTALVFKDCSSNGTFINGMQLNNGMSHMIGLDEHPEILLAGDPDSRIEIDEVKQSLMAKAQARGLDLKTLFQPDGEKRKKDSKKVHGKKETPRSRTLEGAGYRPARDPAETFFGAVGECFKKYADFSGRASRSEYWWFQLFIYIIFSILGLVFVSSDLKPEIIGAFIVAYAGLFLPQLAVLVRRLHDIGKSGNQIWLTFIPIANIFFSIRIFIWMFRPGQPFPNKYGDPPGVMRDVSSYGSPGSYSSQY